jgi:hypothetical protein
VGLPDYLEQQNDAGIMQPEYSSMEERNKVFKMEVYNKLLLST